jgi:hypothetical protein
MRNGGVKPEIDVFIFTLDYVIDFLVDNTSLYHEFSNFINDRPNFYDRFNIKAMEIFDLPMLPISESGVRVTKEYVLRPVIHYGELFAYDSFRQR